MPTTPTVSAATFPMFVPTSGETPPPVLWQRIPRKTAVVERIATMTMEPAASIRGWPSFCDCQTQINAVSNPGSAAVSSKSTVKTGVLARSNGAEEGLFAFLYPECSEGDRSDDPLEDDGGTKNEI